MSESPEPYVFSGEIDPSRFQRVEPLDVSETPPAQARPPYRSRTPQERSRRSLLHGVRTSAGGGRLGGREITPEEAMERNVDRLPALASTIYEGTLNYGWEPRLIVLLAGTRDVGSPLNCLRGMEGTMIRHIYSYIASQWADHVTLTIPAQCVGYMSDGRGEYVENEWILNPGRMSRHSFGRKTLFHINGWKIKPKYDRLDHDFPIVSTMKTGESDKPQGFVAFARIGLMKFPEPSDRNVNMMPFIIGDKSSLPEELQDYYESSIEICPYNDDEIGKVGYLTVHESYVDANTAQRREGLHIESPGTMYDGEGAAFSPALEHHWGSGNFFEEDKFDGGIYMASSVGNTSELWDALVHNVEGIVDRHGGCEHLRPLIGQGTKLEANEIVWMTDRTPHQALPQEESGYRQFFRLVTSNVSHWFAEHSTPNPKVPLPEDVVVVHGNKFG